MRFAAVHLAFTRAAPFVVSSTSARGTWTSVYAFAASIEKHGRVPACAKWDDRQWLGAALVTASDVAEAVSAGLLVWDEDGGLVVVGYDMDGEAKVAAARENGRKGGRPRETDRKPIGKPKRNRPVSSGISQGKPSPNPSSSSVSVSDPLTQTKTGGGGEAENAPAADLDLEQEADRDPEHDHRVEAALAAIRAAREWAIQRNPLITTSEERTHLAELGEALRNLPDSDLALVQQGAPVKWFYLRTGRNRRDTFWRDERWSFHVLATQGLACVLADRRAGIRIGRDGWPLDPDGYEQLIVNELAAGERR